jgi:hypothetical protein
MHEREQDAVFYAGGGPHPWEPRSPVLSHADPGRLDILCHAGRQVIARVGDSGSVVVCMTGPSRVSVKCGVKVVRSHAALESLSLVDYGVGCVL